jgi:hypothetical protein
VPASMLPLHPARLRPPARCHGWRRPPAGSARRHGAFGDVVRTDLAGSLRLSGKVDLLLFNPPYVATPREEMEGSGISISWAGGVDGRCVRVRPRWGGGGGDACVRGRVRGPDRTAAVCRSVGRREYWYVWPHADTAAAAAAAVGAANGRGGDRAGDESAPV